MPCHASRVPHVSSITGSSHYGARSRSAHTPPVGSWRLPGAYMLGHVPSLRNESLLLGLYEAKASPQSRSPLSLFHFGLSNCSRFTHFPPPFAYRPLIPL